MSEFTHHKTKRVTKYQSVSPKKRWRGYWRVSQGSEIADNTEVYQDELTKNNTLLNRQIVLSGLINSLIVPRFSPNAYKKFFIN